MKRINIEICSSAEMYEILKMRGMDIKNKRLERNINRINLFFYGTGRSFKRHICITVYDNPDTPDEIYLYEGVFNIPYAPANYITLDEYKLLHAMTENENSSED